MSRWWVQETHHYNMYVLVKIHIYLSKYIYIICPNRQSKDGNIIARVKGVYKEGLILEKKHYGQVKSLCSKKEAMYEVIFCFPVFSLLQVVSIQVQL